ncbi:MAG: diacylglycerol kinase family lipid kinase [Calditrichaceae bacterium]
MKYLFIINPKSGVRHPLNQIKNYIKTAFENKPNLTYKIEYTQYAGHAKLIAEQAADENTDMVVAAGGDGTVNEVCSALVHKNTAFGLIPIGSGNGFARSLNIPLNFKEAIDLLIKGTVSHIDVGQIGDKYFFGVAGFSLDAQIGAKFAEFGHRGPLPYFYIVLKEFFKYQYEKFELTFDSKKIIINPLILTIANTSQFGNGAIIAPQADYSDGLMDICIVDRLDFFSSILKLNYLFNHKIQLLSTYKSYCTRKLHINRASSFGYYHLDGEVFSGENGFDIEILPRSLSVCC